VDTYKIYGLYDPRRPEVVTKVGKTRLALCSRLAGHVAEARQGRGPKRSGEWIRSLLNDGVRPCIKLLATTTKRSYKICERRFITIWRKRNPDLLNERKGGEGNDSGVVKLVCDVCGSKRKKVPTGSYCPKCRLVYNCKWRQTAKYRGWRRGHYRTAEYREWSSKRRSKLRYKERHRHYTRDWCRANKLGLTVAEYRQQHQGSLYPPSRQN